MYNIEPTNNQYLFADSQISAPLLETLSLSASPATRARVAEHGATPVGTLLNLLQDSNSDVRLSLSLNEALPKMMLRQLAQDPNPDVRYGMAEDPHLPLTILNSLADDENPYVAHRAAKTLARLANTQQSIQSVA